jgi:uncharacterized protein (TIGR03435 family)
MTYLLLGLACAKEAALAAVPRTPWARTAMTLAAIVVGMMSVPASLAQTVAAATPKFEVVSVKPCKAGDGGGGGRKGASDGSPSPGRLELTCRTVIDLVQIAYIQYADGKLKPPGRHVPISGGPPWIDSGRYSIDAKAEGIPGQNVMRGPMLQALLEDRFQLKIHRETREVPVYALTVAKGGLKLQIAQPEGAFPGILTIPCHRHRGRPASGLAESSLHLAPMTDLICTLRRWRTFAGSYRSS